VGVNSLNDRGNRRRARFGGWGWFAPGLMSLAVPHVN